MATLKQIIYNIKNIPGKEEHTDDKKLSDRQLEFIINHFRAELASQRANANKSLDGFYQQLNDVKLQSTKDIRPYNRDVSIQKSHPIPEMCKSHEVGDIIKYVGSRDDFMGYQQSSLSTYNIDLENPYVQNTFFTLGDKLYVASKNQKFLREIFIEAVFENPRKVLEFEGVEIDPFDPSNWEYPIPEGLIGQLNNMIINGEYRWMQAIPADQINDGKENQ